MQHLIRDIPSWVPQPAVSVPAGRTLKCSHGPLAPRMAHSDQHGDPPNLHGGRHAYRHASPQNLLPGCSYLAADARQISFRARAAALMLRKYATGLRALGLKPASLLRTAPASLPAPRSRRAPAGQGQSQPRRGAQDGPSKRCERSLSVRNVCAARPAPDHRPIHSLRSFMTRPVVGRASRLTEAPPPSRLGALLPAVARWGSLLLLLRPWGACAYFRWRARKFLPAFARSWGTLRNRECFRPSRRSLGCARKQAARPAPVAGATCAQLSAGERGNLFAQPARAACPRPNARGFLLPSRPIAAHRTFKQGSNDFQSSSISFSNDLQTAPDGCSKSLQPRQQSFTQRSN
jgi:hypothetical protein